MSIAKAAPVSLAAPDQEGATGRRRLAHWLRAAADLLYDWHQRAQDRHTLARLGARELKDLGLSPNDRAEEVDKPFWRA